jgi:hypothetical protein
VDDGEPGAGPGGDPPDPVEFMHRLRASVDRLIAEAVEPLRDEVAELRRRVEALEGGRRPPAE